MRVSRIRILFAVTCLYLIAVSCISYPNPIVVLNNADKDKLFYMPGTIELTLAQYKTIWFYSIKKGDLWLKSIETIPPTYLIERPRIGYGDEEVPQKLPKIPGYIYFGPYCFSPNKSYTVVALSAVDDKLYAKDFALIKQDSREVVFQTKNNERYVDDIAWAADSKKFAVIDHLAERKHWPIDIFSAMFGVYRDYHTFFLSVYDLQGNLIVKAEIASNIINGSGQIVWKSE